MNSSLTKLANENDRENEQIRNELQTVNHLVPENFLALLLPSRSVLRHVIQDGTTAREEIPNAVALKHPMLHGNATFLHEVPTGVRLYKTSVHYV